MNAVLILPCVIRPAMALLGSKYDSQTAIKLLLAIGFQESEFSFRAQVGGPALSYWQFEQGGGVRGVLRHHTSAEEAFRICNDLDYVPSETIVYPALRNDSLLACAFARLLLWTDPKPLPTLQGPAWDYYKRTWRPGKPRPDKWASSWRFAEDVLKGANP